MTSLKKVPPQSLRRVNSSCRCSKALFGEEWESGDGGRVGLEAGFGADERWESMFIAVSRESLREK